MLLTLVMVAYKCIVSGRIKHKEILKETQARRSNYECVTSRLIQYKLHHNDN
jgi:hypothetical protein